MTCLKINILLFSIKLMSIKDFLQFVSNEVFYILFDTKCLGMLKNTAQATHEMKVI